MDGSVRGGLAPRPEPFSTEAFAAIRAHPRFRAAVEHIARGNLANYGAASTAERWLTSDRARAGLSGSVLVLDAMFGGFPVLQLVQSALANRTCSEGCARLYLRRAAANGFLEVDADGTHRVAPRMRDVMAPGTKVLLQAAAWLDPALEAAVAVAHDHGFLRWLAVQLGLNTVARPDLFYGPDTPVVLFLRRDGGVRILEQMIAAQQPGRARLLETAPLSQRSLAQHAFVSRPHVARLLAEGQARGFLHVDGRRLTASAALSDDVEQRYALMLETGRVSALAALAG